METQEGANLVRDIFATNVIAKDPYTQRTIELIDAYGCPVDPSVFPALGLSRSGEGIEVRKEQLIFKHLFCFTFVIFIFLDCFSSFQDSREQFPGL